MMKQLIPAAIIVLAIAAGGTGGSYLKASLGSAEAEPGGKAEPGAKPEPSGSAKSKPDHGSPPGGDDVAYFKFSREFVVPLMRDGSISSLVILNINLEVDAEASSKLFSMEPKLRDNIMTTLVALSNDGRTLHSLTAVDSYESIRAVILANLDNVLPGGVRNVLILDSAKQDI